MVSEILGVVTSSITIAVIGYLYTLGTRVTVLETREPDIERIMNGKFELVFSKIDDVKRRIEGIERTSSAIGEILRNGRDKHA